jgi:hypothetical protein
VAPDDRSDEQPLRADDVEHACRDADHGASDGRGMG